MRRYFQPVLNTVTLIFLFFILILPNRLSDITLLTFLNFPIELLLLGLVVLVSGRLGLITRVLASVILAAGMIFKIADISAYQVFARTFNPVFDAYLLADGLNLLNGAIGIWRAFGVALLLVAMTFGVVILAFLILERARIALNINRKVSALVMIAGIFAWSGLKVIGWERASSPFYNQIAAHISDVFISLDDIKSFQKIVNIDSYADAPANSLFGKLKGKDVLVVFIESYGRTVLDQPDFARHIQPLLQKSSVELSQNGFISRSGFITSPTVGGISWLAHATTLSGLWIDSQVRYDSLLISNRPTLNRLFKNSGWRTSAVMPAITMAWPAGNYFGYDKIYAAAELDYKGKPFNWITMPDQYTLSVFEMQERKPVQTPVMSEIALISSHAPWTPVPHLINWNDVGDGEIFNSQAEAGDSPEVVWKNNNHVREQYRKSIEYVLATLVSYVTHYGDDSLVILALGDHQPAPLVTGNTKNRDVLIHLIARDPKVFEAVEGWNWSEGMLPAADAPVWRMDEIRNRFIETFSE